MVINKRDRNQGYEFYDWPTKKHIPYGPPDTARPAAVYKGVVWSFVSPNLLVPTFVDLLNPHVVFYNLSRVIKVKLSRDSKSTPQEHFGDFSQSAKFPRLMCNDFKGTPRMQILDLETSSVTLIRSPYEVMEGDEPLKKPFAVDEERAKFRAGFVQGKFRVSSGNE